MPAKHKTTPKRRLQVKRLAAAGLTQERAARFMGLTAKTFMKHYRHEFETGLDGVIEKLFDKTYDVALDDDHKDATVNRLFILKTRGGFKETSVQEISGEITNNHKGVVDVTGLSVSALEELANLKLDGE